MKVGNYYHILKDTFTDFFKDKALGLSAALAYYAVFSLGPLLILIISIAGLVFDKAHVQDQVQTQIKGLVGGKTADLVGGMLSAQSKETHGIMTIVGIVVLIFAATGVFGQLQSSLNTIWQVATKPGRGVWGFLRDRFLSFSMVLGIAFLLLVSMVISTVLEALGTYSSSLPLPVTVAKVLHFVISFGVVTLLFAMIFQILPDASVKWRDVWVGAMGTALLFTVGKFGLGHYLARESVTSAYGAAGSLVVILLWVYYSSAILFLGAEFTQVYALQRGSRIVPTKNAVTVSQQSRDEQALLPKAGAVAPSPQTPLPSSPSRGENEPKQAAVSGGRRGPKLVLTAIVLSFVGRWLIRKWSPDINKIT